MRAAQALVAVVFPYICGSCAPEPGIRPADAGTYVLSRAASGGNAGLLIAQNAALQEARAFCATQGRRFYEVADSLADATFSAELTYSVRFRCPDAGAPELPRPTVNQGPDEML